MTFAGDADEQPGGDAVDQVASGINGVGDLAALTAGQPLLGRALAADADVGGTATDVDPVGGGDELHPCAVIDRPDLADMGGNEGRGPWPGRDADNAGPSCETWYASDY
ncbi:hypothetical protein [Mesorhizobium sp. M0633]|uniref:hypothetical protein n=1 Tax=Mesorhizobium sp. M0633 TaxID=2956977 RepID=UPI00333CEC5A